jgi:RimJ/RimL family protein N-acetyltransferase
VTSGGAAGEFGDVAITTRRLLLTPLRPEDAGQMAVVLGDARLHEFIGGSPASSADLKARYRLLAAGSPDPGEIWLNWIMRLRPTGELAGTVQATVTQQDGDWTAAVAWVVGVPWQGRGYASEAAGALVDWLAGQGAAVITAHIHPGHHGSAAVAARAGLAPTSREADGERVWQLIRCP